MFAQRYGVPMQDAYQKSQPDAGRFGFREQFAGGPLRLGQLMMGGNHPAMQMPGPMTGGNLPAQGGYDSGGINPGGMYTGGQLPPMQSSYPMLGQQPQGLAAMFRGYSPYRYG
jgi:hypothetical protein